MLIVYTSDSWCSLLNTFLCIESQYCTKSLFSVLIIFITGDGKSHYVLTKLQNCSSSIVIPVNEGFNLEKVLDTLCSLPLNVDRDDDEVYGVFFNFTLCYPKVCA